jgi:hypothetical protein
VETDEKATAEAPSNSPEIITSDASAPLFNPQHSGEIEAFPTANSTSPWPTREQEVSDVNSSTGVLHLLPSFPTFDGQEKKITMMMTQAIFCLPPQSCI